MKKLVALACAASALALSSSAFAQTIPANTYSLTINGSVPPICNIASVDKPSVGGAGAVGATFTPGSGTTGTINLPNLAGANGVVQAASATTNVYIALNGTCSASLTSAHGGLYNTSHTNAAVIAYSASINSNGSSANTGVIPTTPNTQFSTVSFGFDPSLPTRTLAVALGILGGGNPVAAGSYTDTLTMTLQPAV